MANNWKGLLNKNLMMMKILSTINTCSNGGLSNLTGYLTQQDGIPENSYANTCKLNDCFILPYRSYLSDLKQGYDVDPMFGKAYNSLS